MLNFLKKIFISSVLLFTILLQTTPVYAVRVNGYYRANGTYVNSYERTAPDGNPYNNYSYPGNYNPNTGSITGGNPQTYLDNYYDTSSYGNSYSYPTTPTCPLNSYYDGISSCKCNYGYAVSGSSCVSQDSLCWDQTGYSSSYDSMSNTCKCNYGYIIGTSGKCVNANSYCSDILGLMSEYNSSSRKCECMVGYEYDGSSCVYKKSSYSYPSAYTDNSSLCPINSHVSTSDITKCSCDAGYQVNSAGDSCVIKVTKTNSQICQDSFGYNVEWDGTFDTGNGQLNCNCKSGYVWNNTRTTCVLTPKIETANNSVIENIPVTKITPKEETKNVEAKSAIISKKVDTPKIDWVASSSGVTTSSTIKIEEKKVGWWNSFLGWFKFK